MAEPITLSYTRHDRDSAGRLYVYPVLSRRAGGISLGINLNVNNACNWSCIYCQVEGLSRGGPDPIDLARLEAEFTSLLQEILQGNVLVTDAPSDQRKLVDVAFSGNGEPTSAPEFPQIIELVYRVLAANLPGHRLPVRVISNGSLMYKSHVQVGIASLGRLGGEVWFKVDRVLPDSSLLINGITVEPEKTKRNLVLCAELAPTWVQTCWLAIDGLAPSEADRLAYIDFLHSVKSSIQGVLLYGMARASASAQARRLSRLPAEEIEQFALRVRQQTGLRVTASM